MNVFQKTRQNSRMASNVAHIGSSNKAQISNALSIVKRAGMGDFEARILNVQAKGELGELLHAINDMIDRCDAYVRESQACMEYVSKNEYFRKIIERGMPGSFLNASSVVNSALDSMQQKVIDFQDMTGSFEGSVAAVVETVASASTELTGSAQSLASIASATTEKSTIVAAASEEASANVQTVAAASEQLTSSIQEISQQISLTSKVVTNATDVSNNVMKQVSELQKAGEQINNAVGLIQDIAEQTNLLALNATIEAARAGEAGKGFAVVASEVKSLAQETSKATEEISGYVHGIQSAMKNTIDGIKDVAAKVEEVSEGNAAISSAIEEQSSATQEIARNIEQASAGTAEVNTSILEVSNSAGKTGASASELENAANELSQQSEMLNLIVSDYLSKAKDII